VKTVKTVARTNCLLLLFLFFFFEKEEEKRNLRNGNELEIGRARAAPSFFFSLFPSFSSSGRPFRTLINVLDCPRQ